ncbi:hypothetical protein OnM2_033059 [Erysiphe neolycopersici]|uniref:Uncharacterized protein n=1 Tax=Erysiphe neolycopersici TaxID=212602 RepID=A0A420HYC2_9PEZI|nr:hypothetical protein OnM2_033059 [Erysiphe neolycopersici]
MKMICSSPRIKIWKWIKKTRPTFSNFDYLYGYQIKLDKLMNELRSGERVVNENSTVSIDGSESSSC